MPPAQQPPGVTAAPVADELDSDVEDGGDPPDGLDGNRNTGGTLGRGIAATATSICRNPRRRLTDPISAPSLC